MLPIKRPPQYFEKREWQLGRLPTTLHPRLCSMPGTRHLLQKQPSGGTQGWAPRPCKQHCVLQPPRCRMNPPQAPQRHSQCHPGTCLSGSRRSGAGCRGRCCSRGGPGGSWAGRWMPGSRRSGGTPVLWGVQRSGGRLLHGATHRDAHTCAIRAPLRAALPSPRHAGAMIPSQYTPPAQGSPAQRGTPQPGRAVRQPRVLPGPPQPPLCGTQAPARRQPAGSHSNYQLGREPGPCASTTAPRLNSVGPRSGGAGATACRGGTAGPPPPTAAPMNRSCSSSQHSSGSHHPSSPLHMQHPGVPQHLQRLSAPLDSAPQSAHRCHELPGLQPSSVHSDGGQHLRLQPHNTPCMQHTKPCPVLGEGGSVGCASPCTAHSPSWECENQIWEVPECGPRKAGSGGEAVGPEGWLGAPEPRLPLRKLPMKDEAGALPISPLPAAG